MCKQSRVVLREMGFYSISLVVLNTQENTTRAILAKTGSYSPSPPKKKDYSTL